MNTATVLYSFVGEVTTPHGARLTACGRIRAPAGYVPKAYEAAADATADLIKHRPDPTTGVKLTMVQGSEVFAGIAQAVQAACEVWGGHSGSDFQPCAPGMRQQAAIRGLCVPADAMRALVLRGGPPHGAKRSRDRD